MTCVWSFILTAFKTVMLDEIDELKKIDCYNGLTDKCEQIRPTPKGKEDKQSYLNTKGDSCVFPPNAVGISQLFRNGSDQMAIDTSPPR
tara:strand:- start:8558 stop:8824 length:267 start_codon:yes stop_codon:yes gene_type:complete